jgi:tetratricopeptide (TPR) repeat protein
MSSQLEITLQSLLGDAYLIRRELPGAGMSRVFVAYEPALKREVAVKVLPPDLRSLSSVARFRQEIEVTAQLQHPHILPLIGAGGDERLLYYIMPFVAGGSLRDLLAKGVVPMQEATTLSAELLSAVAFAHARGILHRDIKPGNVLVSQGHAVLADFGIARALEAMHEVDAAGSTSVASPEAYRAPERPTGAAADLYAMAVLSYEMLTGNLPRPGISEGAITAGLLEAQHGAAPERVRVFARALARALSRDPDARFATAADFRAAILSADSRRPRVAVIGAAGALAAALAVLWWSSRDDIPSRAAIAPRLAARPAATSAAPAGDPQPIRPPVYADTGRQQVSIAAPPRPDSISVQAHNSYRVALSSAWAGGGALAVEGAARAAIAALESGKLDRRERLLANGVVALARRDYPLACAAFDSALAIREDYDAWMGAGECRQRDSRVIVTGDSASFRSSFYRAALAYVEAARRAPAGESIAFERFPSVAFTEPGRVRTGTTDDGRMYLGRALAIGDSFTFAAFQPGPVRASPGTLGANSRAAVLARELVRPVMLAWSRREPGNARARIRLVELLEAAGNIREAGKDGVTAYDEVEAARRLAVAPRDRLRLAQTHVRILLRAREYERAAHLADSLLETNPSPTAVDAESLVPLAFLTGKAARAAELLELVSGSPSRQIRLADGQFLGLPPAIVRERAAFIAAATLGVCTPEVQAAPARLASMLGAMFPARQTPRGVEGAFLERPLVLAFPCVGADRARVIRGVTNPLAGALLAPDAASRAQWMHRHAAVNAERSATDASYETSESAFGEALAHLAGADTSAALTTLRRVLDAVPALPIMFLNNEVQAGTLTRSMALAAELAHALGKERDAAEWAAGAASLWAHADSPLQPTAKRLRKLADDIMPGGAGSGAPPLP